MRGDRRCPILEPETVRERRRHRAANRPPLASRSRMRSQLRPVARRRIYTPRSQVKLEEAAAPRIPGSFAGEVRGIRTLRDALHQKCRVAEQVSDGASRHVENEPTIGVT